MSQTHDDRLRAAAREIRHILKLHGATDLMQGINWEDLLRTQFPPCECQKERE